MKKIICAFLLSIISVISFAEIITVPIPGAPGLSVTIGTGVNALPLQNIQNHPNSVNITMGDDDWRNVALPYTFPYFGQNFNQSWMLSNGAVTFQDPSLNAGGMCCSGVDLSTLTDTRYNYTIFGIWTDLIATNPNSHYYLHQGNSTTYGWYNVNQYGTGNQNSFEIKIDSSGLVDTRIGGALVSYAPVTSGMTGDLSQGQYYQYYYGQGINIPYGAGISWQALSGTGGDICLSNPLSSPSCPGYQSAYLTQQCSINPLYDSACPGYAVAYFTLQCSLDPLYNSECPGYAEAYAKKYVLNIDTTGTSSTTQTTTETVSTTEPSVQISSTGTVSTSVSTTGNTTVDSVINTTTTSASPANATATVPLTSSTQTTQQVNSNANTQTSQKSETKTETKTASSNNDGTKDRANNTAKNSTNAERAKEQLKSASTFEGQVAAQNSVIGVMSFVPGFSQYAEAKVPDVLGLQLQRQYGKNNVDNLRIGRNLFGASDRLHEEMVNQQYR